MDSKLRAKVLTMAAATLGLSLVGACGSKAAETTTPESAEPAAGSEASCGGENSCGAAKEGEAAAPAEGEAAPAEGEAPAEAPK